MTMNVVDSLRLPGLDSALVQVEATLAEATQGEDPFLTEVAGHLASAGGKRLRPALVVASAQACLGSESVSSEVIRGGVAVELVHLGSLYHDDVIDGAEYRRGVQSVNSRWGNLVAILAGDFLLARASEIAASLGTEVAALLARTIGALCEGEVGQLQYAFNSQRPEESYFASIAGKTASLMSTAARIGGIVSGAPRTLVDALTEYGHSIGMAFQIWDDIRDLVSTDGELGKPAGHDMVEGTYTLPVLKALAIDGIGDDLRALLGTSLDPPSVNKARDLILSSPAIGSSVEVAREWAERASTALDPLRGQTDGRVERVEVLGNVGHRLLDQLDIA
jgi:heptaprenyl diphosphate synthase